MLDHVDDENQSNLFVESNYPFAFLLKEGIVASTIGMAGVFSLVGGITTEYFGRKPVILVASVVFTAGAIIMAAAFNKKLLLVGRQIIGKYFYAIVYFLIFRMNLSVIPNLITLNTPENPFWLLAYKRT